MRPESGGTCGTLGTCVGALEASSALAEWLRRAGALAASLRHGQTAGFVYYGVVAELQLTVLAVRTSGCLRNALTASRSFPFRTFNAYPCRDLYTRRIVSRSLAIIARCLLTVTSRLK